MTVRRSDLILFVDRLKGQWIARDGDGNYWVIPPTDNPWQDRQPFAPSEETELESVPGHYKSMLGLAH